MFLYRTAIRSPAVRSISRFAGSYHANFASAQASRSLHQGLAPICRPYSARSSFRPEWRNHFEAAVQQQHAQRRQYGRTSYRKTRLQRSAGFFRAWAARPTFLYEVGGLGAICGGVYVINLETVPISGRRRFNIISNELEASLTADGSQYFLQQFAGQILPPQSREHRLVRGILDRLLPHSGMDLEGWEVHVIRDPGIQNAMVTPDNRAFVFTGIIDACRAAGDEENCLAAVMGHELAHNVAHHIAEKMSKSVLLLPISVLAALFAGIDPSFVQVIHHYLFSLPGSRAQEAEADQIGLMIMAESCYDPSAAVRLWQFMEQAEKASGAGDIPEFLSTHPSNHGRLESLKELLPRAEKKRQGGGCASLGRNVSEFGQLVQLAPWSSSR